MLGAIELGGTSVRCAVADTSFVDGFTLKAQTSISTSSPPETLQLVRDFFDAARAQHGGLHAFGVASFGPVCLDSATKLYGRMLNTPKLSWQNYDLLGELRAQLALNIPIAIDTDVNAAAVAESRCYKPFIDNLAYITVGTGIGVGAIVAGQPLHGILHPEFGHLLMDPEDEEPQGACAFHGNCVEGLASGQALADRWGVSSAEAPRDHPMWRSEAIYLARLCVAVTLAYSPSCIVLGGGVMAYEGLLDNTYKYFEKLMANYLPLQELLPKQHLYIRAPLVKEGSGLVGALHLARDQLKDKSQDV